MLAAVACLCGLHLRGGLFCEPAQVSCLLCACSCCLPVWLALVQGSRVSQHMVAARSALAVVACLCGLFLGWALV